MENKKFKAMLVEETGERIFSRKITQRSLDELPQGEVLVKVLNSSLNYKDALSASGNKGVTRKFPHTPGIDAAGIVEQSVISDFKPGDKVIVTSYDLGMNTPGGFGEYIRVPGAWVVKLPDNLSIKESMVYGTAGFTAGMSVWYLSQIVKPDKGDILVTGATGGVGSLAVAILSKCGYSVTAVTGKMSEKQFLFDLGAKAVIDRNQASDTSGKPLLKARWAGVVDTVGGDILASAVKSTDQYGVVTCCGNAASPDLPLNVFPFILRGVSLIGIDSQNCPMDTRVQIWEKLAGDWKLSDMDSISKTISLDELDQNIELILKGQQKGRVVVDLAL
ncbi:Putative quinone oxidoreductase, YhdH/YhfP family [Desulfonema limicola]|uniref:Quinone oxidoreductase, YhdH/YhfP family n=1 Tax=Desulfonema limicola TaxID=45656 RepID=A0A975BCW7_9BACT|nr:YhdH/YhfP family quinone oxidoreductase [Desulfonema limicola]QTA82884.1 Putative quinone oxidoreductase, YhdH/YhfP family [Desulfonema limicola]